MFLVLQCFKLDLDMLTAENLPRKLLLFFCLDIPVDCKQFEEHPLVC